MVGSFLYHSPEFCFVVENAQGAICAYILAALNATSFFENVESFWIPNVTSKYKEELEKKDLSSPEVRRKRLGRKRENCFLITAETAALITTSILEALIIIIIIMMIILFNALTPWPSGGRLNSALQARTFNAITIGPNARPKVN